MKSGALRVHSRGEGGLVLADVGRDPRSSDSWESQAKFCFFLSGKQHHFTDFPSAKFEHNTSIGVTMKTFATEFWKLYQKGSF